MDKTKTRKQEILPIILGLAFIFSISLALGAIQINNPLSNYNYSTSVLLNVSYINGSDSITSPTSTNTTFYNNNVAITCTGFGCNAVSCWCTATADQLTDGLARTISAVVGNITQLNTTTSGGNSTNVGFYTSTPACVYTYDPSNAIVKTLDPIGLVTTDASTKDALTTLTYSWRFYDPEGNSITTSSSASPTFSDSDVEDIGQNVLALRVTDTFGNTNDCANVTVTVNTVSSQSQRNAALQETITTKKKSTALWWLLGGIAVLIVLVIISFFIISESKK